MFEGLHDAEIVLIDSSESREKLRIRIRDTLGVVRDFVFEGCRFFRIEDYVRQNVISHILYFSGPDLVEFDAKRLLLWATSFSDADSYLTDPLLEEILDQIRKSRLTLLGFVPSMGAEVAILFVEAKEA
jgi:hypothetical protein